MSCSGPDFYLGWNQGQNLWLLLLSVGFISNAFLPLPALLRNFVSGVNLPLGTELGATAWINLKADFNTCIQSTHAFRRGRCVCSRLGHRVASCSYISLSGVSALLLSEFVVSLGVQEGPHFCLGVILPPTLLTIELSHPQGGKRGFLLSSYFPYYLYGLLPFCSFM